LTTSETVIVGGRGKAPSGEHPTDAPDALDSVQTELLATHLRNLIEFLYPDEYQAEENSVSAHHFLAPSPEVWEDWVKTKRPGLATALRDAKKRANEEMAHLTTGRKSDGDVLKDWNPRLLIPCLQEVLAVFERDADLERLGPEARAAIKRLLTLT
jgi:hypothetical protein